MKREDRGEGLANGMVLRGPFVRLRGTRTCMQTSALLLVAMAMFSSCTPAAASDRRASHMQRDGAADGEEPGICHAHCELERVEAICGDGMCASTEEGVQACQ